MGFWRTHSTHRTSENPSRRDDDARPNKFETQRQQPTSEGRSVVQDRVMNMLALHDELRARLLAAPRPRLF